MVWPDYFDEVTNLINFCDEAGSAVPDWEYCFENITNETDLGRLKDKNANSFVYIFKMVGNNTDEVKKALCKQKTCNHTKHRKCPKVNKKSSQFLYVGSSRRNILGRIKQHLGQCPDATYALKLFDWFTGHAHLYGREYSGISPTALQILEDSISEKLKPMFGKQGGNGK